MLYRLLLKILWLGYRFGLTLRFFFKYFILFKLISIIYDYKLGYYPKIFNDQGFYQQFLILYNFLKSYIFYYYFEIIFILFLFIFYLYIYWPFFYEIRDYREHLDFKSFELQDNKSSKSLKEIELNKIELKLNTLFKEDIGFINKTIDLQKIKLKHLRIISKKKKNS